MSRFNQKVILITGASAGIGAALAREFAQQQAKLVLIARRQDRLEALAKSLDPTGDNILTVKGDVTRAEDLEQAVALAHAKFGAIDITIANAGWSIKGNLDELRVEDYRQQWETNVFGVLHTIYATLADLKKTQGRLVVISSVKSYIALAGDSPYSSSKFALRALVCPGYVATEIRQVDEHGVLHSDVDPIPPILLRSAEQTAQAMVKAIDRRQPEQILTAYGKLVVFLQRYCPWLVAGLISRLNIKVKSRTAQQDPQPQDD
jgi:uncharacterized protein